MCNLIAAFKFWNTKETLDEHMVNNQSRQTPQQQDSTKKSNNGFMLTDQPQISNTDTYFNG